MPHTYECPMRWADMDLLGHVNNVTYLDYLAEGRARALAGLPAEHAPVRQHRIEFVAPLVFHRHPVLVDTSVVATGPQEVTLAQEVYDAAPEGRTTYLRAETVLGHALTGAESDRVAAMRGEQREWRPVSSTPGPARDTYPVTVRHSDLDRDGRASDISHVEFFQEARIHYLMNLHTRGQGWSHHVVARTDLQYLAPVPHRAAAYVVDSRISHLGSRSFTIAAELRDPDREQDQVLARAQVVMVTFDKESQRSRAMADSQRERLQQELDAEHA